MPRSPRPPAAHPTPLRSFLARVTPVPIRKLWWFWQVRVAAAAPSWRMGCGPLSVWRLLNLSAPTFYRPTTLRRVRIRQLGCDPIYLRAGTSDFATLKDTVLGRFHVPPVELAQSEIVSILDLGANIGSTMVHLSKMYPSATIVGVEPDPGNAELARVNTRSSTNCSVVESAVWDTTGRIRFSSPPGQEFGARIDEVSGKLEVTTATISELLDLLPGGQADFVKMDIEGAEAIVLRSTDRSWTHRVKVLNVEIHWPYTVAECLADLSNAGYNVRTDASHPALVIAFR